MSQLSSSSECDNEGSVVGDARRQEVVVVVVDDWWRC